MIGGEHRVPALFVFVRANHVRQLHRLRFELSDQVVTVTHRRLEHRYLVTQGIDRLGTTEVGEERVIVGHEP
jgi:hypothetical protein